MDFATVISAVSSVGFPIVFCFVLYKTLMDQNKQHKEEMGEITKAITNNTLAIQKLTDKLDKENE